MFCIYFASTLCLKKQTPDAFSNNSKSLIQHQQTFLQKNRPVVRS